MRILGLDWKEVAKGCSVTKESDTSHSQAPLLIQVIFTMAEAGPEQEWGEQWESLSQLGTSQLPGLVCYQ